MQTTRSLPPLVHTACAAAALVTSLGCLGGNAFPRIVTVVVEHPPLGDADGLPQDVSAFDLGAWGEARTRVAGAVFVRGEVVVPSDATLQWSVQDPDEPWTLAGAIANARGATLDVGDDGWLSLDPAEATHCVARRPMYSSAALDPDDQSARASGIAMCPEVTPAWLWPEPAGPAPWEQMQSHQRGAALTVAWDDGAEHDRAFVTVLAAVDVGGAWAVEPVPVYDELPQDFDALWALLDDPADPAPTAREIPGEVFDAPGVYFVSVAVPGAPPATSHDPYADRSLLAVSDVIAVWVAD